MRALPTVPEKDWRNPREQAQAEGMVLRGIDSLQASGVEVDFGWSPLDMPRMRMEVAEEWALQANVTQTMRRAEYVLRSKIDLPRARCESVQEAMFRCLPGVGTKRADDLISGGWRLELVEGEPVRGVGTKTVLKMRGAMG